MEHRERTEVVFSGPGADAAFARCVERLLLYQIYPPSIVRGEVLSDDGRAKTGASIDQRIRYGPLIFRGPVLITDAWERASGAGHVIGYRYQALPGHVERGVAAFELRIEGETVTFRIESDSEPAHWLARLGAPAARHLQTLALDGAFHRMRVAAAGQA